MVCIFELMREAAAWFLVAVLLAVLLWPKPPAPTDNSAALRAENDSLRGEIEARDYREQLMHEAADSMRQRLDSMVNNAPTAQDRYLRFHADIRRWSTDSLWRYLGRMPADTGATRHARALGHGEVRD